MTKRIKRLGGWQWDRVCQLIGGALFFSCVVMIIVSDANHRGWGVLHGVALLVVPGTSFLWASAAETWGRWLAFGASTVIIMLSITRLTDAQEAVDSVLRAGNESRENLRASLGAMRKDRATASETAKTACAQRNNRTQCAEQQRQVKDWDTRIARREEVLSTAPAEAHGTVASNLAKAVTPIGLAIICELSAVYLLGRAFAPRLPPAPPLGGLPLPIERKLRRGRPRLQDNEMARNWRLSFVRQHGREPTFSEMQDRFPNIPRSTVSRLVNEAG